MSDLIEQINNTHRVVNSKEEEENLAKIAKANEAFFSRCTEFQVMGVPLEEAVEQLRVLSGLMPDVIKEKKNKNPTNAETLAEDVVSILEKQRYLAARYEAALEGKAQDPLSLLHNSELEEITKELKHSTVALCKSINENSVVAENLVKVNNEHGFLQGMLHRIYLDVTNKTSYECLIDTVTEIKESRQKLMQTFIREKEISSQVKQVSKQITTTKTKMEEELNECATMIARLKEEKQRVKGTLTLESKYLEKERAARGINVQNKNAHKIEELANERDLAQTKLDRENKAHNETVQYLQLQHDEIEKLIQVWMLKYEQDLENKQKEIEEAKKNRANDLHTMEEKTEQFINMQQYIDDHFAELKALAELERIEKTKHDAATKIQAFIRGCQCRAALKGKKGKKGGGKKGKKGKK
eukprot:Nk52_evm74s1810 gene=Nk52_evmTU74s1810